MALHELNPLENAMLDYTQRFNERPPIGIQKSISSNRLTKLLQQAVKSGKKPPEFKTFAARGSKRKFQPATPNENTRQAR